LQFGQFAGIIAQGVAATSTHVYIVGLTTVQLNGEAQIGLDDAFLLKLDTDLQPGSASTLVFGTAEADTASGVAVVSAPEETVFVTGTTSGSMDGTTAALGTDFFVIAFDASGATLWVDQRQSPLSDRGVGIATLASEVAVFCVGYTIAAFDGQSSFGSRDIFVTRHTLAGTHMFSRQYGTSGIDTASAIAVSDDGIFISGTTSGEFPGQSAVAGGSAFLLRLTLDGTLLWARQNAVTARSSSNGVALGNGLVYITGSTLGESIVRLGDTDIFMAQYDIDGALQDSVIFGTIGVDFTVQTYDDPTGGIALINGSPVIAGYTENGGEGGADGQSPSNEVAAFGRAALATKVSANGTPDDLRILGIGGASTPSQALGIAHIGGTSSAVVVGVSSSELLGADSIMAGEVGAFVARYDNV
jgi:hypothetical protein